MKTLLLGIISFVAAILVWYRILIYREYTSIEEISPNVYKVTYKQAGIEQQITAHATVLAEYGIKIKKNNIQCTQN